MTLIVRNAPFVHSAFTSEAFFYDKVNLSMIRNYVRYFGAFMLLMVIFVSSANAQKNDPPSEQFGVGIYGITNFLPSGFEVTYALDSTIQVGSELSVAISASVGSYLIAPFVRYLYDWIVSPFAQAGLEPLFAGQATRSQASS